MTSWVRLTFEVSMDGYALLFAVMGVAILMLGYQVIRLLGILKVLTEGLFAVADGYAEVRRDDEDVVRFFPTNRRVNHDV
jgi:hypothetical protein